MDTSSTCLVLYSGTYTTQCIPSGYDIKLLSYIPSTNVFLKTIQAWVVPLTAFSRANVYAVVCCAVTPYSCESTFCINTTSTMFDLDILVVWFHISIIKILNSLNTTIYLDVIKRKKQLHVSARGHLQVVSCGFARKYFLQRPVIYNYRGGAISRFTKCGVFLFRLDDLFSVCFLA
jgi:hypothetical protein